MDLDSDGPQIEDYLPRSLDNLRNLSNFTKIRLHFQNDIVSMQFAGPNGWVLITAMAASADANRSVAQSLAQHLENQMVGDHWKRASLRRHSPGTPVNAKPADPHPFSMQGPTLFHPCVSPKLDKPDGMPETGGPHIPY